MLLESAFDLGFGDEITFAIEMSNEMVEGKGTVVRQDAKDRYAVFFDRLEAGGRLTIERALKLLG